MLWCSRSGAQPEAEFRFLYHHSPYIGILGLRYWKHSESADHDGEHLLIGVPRSVGLYVDSFTACLSEASGLLGFEEQ